MIMGSSETDGARHDAPATIKLVDPILTRANTGVAA
jgi:hypothetical protein